MHRTCGKIEARMVLIPAIIGLVLLVGSVSATTLTAGSAHITSTGDTATVSLMLDEAATGLNGYNLTVDLIDDTGKAAITGVTYPPWAFVFLTSNSTWPADTGYLKAAGVLGSSRNVTIATVTIKGLGEGSAKVNVTVHKMSDMMGTNLRSTLTLVPGTVIIGNPGTVPVAAFSPGAGTGAAP